MACDFQFFFDYSSDSDWAQTAMDAFDEIERLESVMSLYRPDSELCRINRDAFADNVVLSDEMGEVVALALDFYRETQGAHDFSATPLSRVWGFFDRKPIVPTAEGLEEARQRVGADGVRLNASQRTLRFERPGMEINLNSLGKGYALDRAVTVLRRQGVSRFMIHGGQSSVVARLGEPSASNAGPEYWTVALTHPLLADERLGEIQIGNEALSTSGSGKQGFYHRGRRLGHILDPRTGWPADSFLSVTTLHPRAVVADALSTALFVMSLEEVETFCKQHVDVKVILVVANSNPTQPCRVVTFNLPPDQLVIFK
jgi:thiamine biosynthesis lipoprotein